MVEFLSTLIQRLGERFSFRVRNYTNIKDFLNFLCVLEKEWQFASVNPSNFKITSPIDL